MARNDFQMPDNEPVINADGKTSVAWSQWFARAHRILSAMQSSGTTADRPTTLLWIGRRYFDESLGLPVYVRSVTPTVWINAAGGVV